MLRVGELGAAIEMDQSRGGVVKSRGGVITRGEVVTLQGGVITRGGTIVVARGE